MTSFIFICFHFHSSRFSCHEWIPTPSASVIWSNPTENRYLFPPVFSVFAVTGSSWRHFSVYHTDRVSVVAPLVWKLIFVQSCIHSTDVIKVDFLFHAACSFTEESSVREVCLGMLTVNIDDRWKHFSAVISCWKDFNWNSAASREGMSVADEINRHSVIWPSPTEPNCHTNLSSLSGLQNWSADEWPTAHRWETLQWIPHVAQNGES